MRRATPALPTDNDWPGPEAWVEVAVDGRTWLVVAFQAWPKGWVSYVQRRGFTHDSETCNWYSATFKLWDITYLSDLLSPQERRMLRQAIWRRERQDDKALDEKRAGRRQRGPGGGRKPLPPEVRQRRAIESRKAWRNDPDNYRREVERQRQRRKEKRHGQRQDVSAGQMGDSEN